MSVSLRQRVDNNYQKWLKRRIPKQDTIELNQRRLFIFPSKQGLAFLLVFLLVLVAAINYQNNLIYAMAFFLASLFNTAILFTFNNLSGLNLSIKKSHNNFVGEHIAFDIALSSSSSKKTHHRLHLHFKEQDEVSEVSLVSNQKSNNQSNLARVVCRASERGYFQAPRLCVESFYPLGIIRCWTWIDLSQTALVYPKPIETQHATWLSDSEEGDVHSHMQGDDFHGLKKYEYGDSLTQAYWPSLAKGQKLQNKEFNSFVADDHWLDYAQLDSGNIEQTLSKLCFLALELDAQGQLYGLRMPDKVIPLGSGANHLKDVLSTLALFGKS